MASCISPSGEPLALTVNFTKCVLFHHTDYEFVVVAADNVQWTLLRRYRQFLHLHEQLREHYNLGREPVFPPKKTINNTSGAFLMQRQRDLQTYLRAILKRFTGLQTPPPLVEFLELEHYEIHGVTSALARLFYQHGATILQGGFPFEFSVFQIHAVNARLKSAAPTNIGSDPASDFGHVMDFVQSLQSLKVRGSTSAFHKSNIIPNQLNIDLSIFKSLLRIELLNVNVSHVFGYAHLKRSVLTLVVHNSLLDVKNLTLGDLYDVGGGQWVFGKDSVSTKSWERASLVDLSENDLMDLDPSMALFSQVKQLNLSKNDLSDVSLHLSSLLHLYHLNFSHNHLHVLEERLQQEQQHTPASSGSVSNTSQMSGNLLSLHARLGNVTQLNVANNNLRSALLLDKCLSLQVVDLSCNRISSIQDLQHISKLPCLVAIFLHHNPICEQPNYRISVFGLFGDRFEEVTLDGEAASESEREIVRIRHALRIGRGEIDRNQ